MFDGVLGEAPTGRRLIAVWVSGPRAADRVAESRGEPGVPPGFEQGLTGMFAAGRSFEVRGCPQVPEVRP